MRRLFAAAALLIAGTLGVAEPSAAGGGHLAVVVSQDSPVTDLSFHELKRLYMGTKGRDPSGRWFLPLNHKKTTRERRSFDESVLGMTPDEVGSYWIDRRIRGQAGAPKVIKNPQLVPRLVAEVPGAIGYIDAAHTRGLKVVRIDGKLPGEPSYPLEL